MFRHTLCLVIAVLLLTSTADGRKTTSGRSRGSSSRTQTSRRTNYNTQSAPTSFGSGSQTAAGAGVGTGLFGWQTASKPAQSSFGHANPSYPSSNQNSGWQVANKPAQSSHVGQSHAYPSSQNSGWQTANKPAQTSNVGQSHGYPSSQTGLSGNNQPPSYQDAVQKQSYPQNNAQKPAYQQNYGQQSHSYPQSGVGQQSHSYPSSNTGLSGNSKPGTGYPQGTGLSGNAPPPYQHGGAYPANNNYGGYQHPAPPPPYPGNYGHGNQGGFGGYNHGVGGGYGGYGSGFGGGVGGPPGYFGGYKNYGGMSRGSSALTGIGLAGAGVGTLLTGLALWNLARSTGSHRHTVIYDNRGQPVAVAPANTSEPVVDPILGELVNCSLTVSSPNATEVLAIPCSIATSFSPNAQNKAGDTQAPIPVDETKCIVGVRTKSGTDLTTSIPCSLLLKTAAENNVTEPPPDALNGTNLGPSPGPLMPGAQGPYIPPNGPSSPIQYQENKCVLPEGATPDPLNPCVPVDHNLTVIPLKENNGSTLPAPAA